MEKKTISDINKLLQQRNARVATAKEVYDLNKQKGPEEVLKQVDLVVASCFSPVPGGSLMFQIPNIAPRIRIAQGMINGIPVTPGFGAADFLLPVSSLPGTDSNNKIFPGEFNYGGGHVIEELVSGKEVFLEADGYGSDTYPRRHWDGQVSLAQIPWAEVVVPAPAGDRPVAGANLSSRTIYTEMGILKADMGNVNYLGSGIYSPFLRDHECRGLIMGEVFIAAAPAQVWHRPEGGYLLTASAKEMDRRWVRGLSMLGFGASLQIAVAVVIPLLEKADLEPLLISEDDITVEIMEMSEAFPQGKEDILARVTFQELHSGKITLRGRETVTAPLSSYAGAREYCQQIKNKINQGELLSKGLKGAAINAG